MAAILKILKTKSTTFSEDLFLCQVSKRSAVRFEFKKNSTMVTMATAAILNLFNSQKLPHTTVDIPTKFYEVRWKESKKKFESPFLFPWQLRKSLSNRFRYFWLISFHYMWMVFLASVIIFVFFNFFSILVVSGQRRSFWKFQVIVLNIPVKFH